jgi:Arginine-tRNA-protein transferase, C terminus
MVQVKLLPSSGGVSDKVIALYRKYQVQVHNDPPSRVTKESFERFLCRSPLQVIVKSTCFNFFFFISFQDCVVVSQ